MSNTDSSDGAPDAGDLETRTNGAAAISRRDLRRAEREFKASARTSATVRPVRSLATIGAVLALLAGVAIPAYAATTNGGDQSASPSAHDIAEQNAQSLAVGADVKADDLDVSKYAATTPEEIERKKAEEEAAKRAKEAAAAAAAASNDSSEDSAPSVDLGAGVEPVDGAAIPLPGGSYCISRSVGSGHAGADMVAPAGTPIYAAKGGTVTVSTEGYFGYGVAVKIQHGDGTETLYGHMTYGSRQVSVGQQVSAGQPIGAVGNTGHSYGAHLHFEYHIGGGVVDPVPYFGLGPHC